MKQLFLAVLVFSCDSQQKGFSSAESRKDAALSPPQPTPPVAEQPTSVGGAYLTCAQGTQYELMCFAGLPQQKIRFNVQNWRMEGGQLVRSELDRAIFKYSGANLENARIFASMPGLEFSSTYGEAVRRMEIDPPLPRMYVDQSIDPLFAGSCSQKQSIDPYAFWQKGVSCLSEPQFKGKSEGCAPYLVRGLSMGVVVMDGEYIHDSLRCVD